MMPDPLSTLGEHRGWVESRDDPNAPWVAHCSCGWTVPTSGDNAAEYMMNAHISHNTGPINVQAEHIVQVDVRPSYWSHRAYCDCGWEHFSRDQESAMMASIGHREHPTPNQVVNNPRSPDYIQNYRPYQPEGPL